MLWNPKNRKGFSFLVGACTLAMSVGLEILPTRAQDAKAEGGVVAPTPAATIPHTTLKPVKAYLAKPYFVEFRSRSALSYGHTYSVYGRLNAQGKIIQSVVAGLHPATESPVPWMIGHLIPVISETGASDGDTEDIYITARYRILLSEAEYKWVTAYIKQLQASSPLWHAAFYNCNAFVADIAKFMGLRTPFLTVQMPMEFINNLRELNGGRREISDGRQQAAVLAHPAVRSHHAGLQ